MTHTNPTIFEVFMPRNSKVDATFDDLATDRWRVALYALYLQSGRYVPDEAKKTRGAWFGYCDETGRQRGKHEPEATHVGWTLDGYATGEQKREVKRRRKL